MTDYNAVADRLISRLGPLNITVLNKHEHGATVRFNGNDKNVVLYWNTFGVFYLAWGDHVREMGHAEDTLEGLRLMAWTFQALG